MLRQLRVDANLDMGAKTLRGFYIDQKDPYDINFGTGVGKVGEKAFQFDTTNVIRGQLDYYVLPSFFKEAFDLHFNIDFNSLSLILSTEQELPVVRDYQREMRRGYMVVSPQTNLEQAPLKFPGKKYLLNGGVVDYSLSAFNTGGPTSYSYSLTGGAEILGGETEGSLLGAVSGGNPSLYSSTLSWKYTFDSSAYISYAGLGNLYSDGLTSYGFRGAQVSNEPLTVRTIFGQYVINARTNPNWDVELYLNGQLAAYKRADAQGRAQFTIPLVYGTTYIQLKYYGPNGQFREEDRRLQIPFSFVPAGQLNYSVSAGLVNNTNYNFLSANALFGITSWATDKLGLDYVDDPLFSKPLLYNSLYLRFGPEYTMSIDAAPDAFYRTSFNALYASQTAFDLEYGHYSQNMLYNPSLRLQELQADAFVPFYIGRNSLNFRVAGIAQTYYGGQKSYSYSANFSSSLSQLNVSVGYTKSIIDYGVGPTDNNYNLTGSVLYSLCFGQGAFNFLNGTLVSVTGRYGVLKNSPDDISLQLSKNVLRYVRIGFTADRNYINKATTFNLQIIADLPFIRSTTSAQFQGGSGFYSQNFSGSVGYDSNYGQFLFNDLGWVGRSAASVRMFVDANGNGRYDKGEEIIRHGSITLRQAVSSETSSNGITREWNMLPYTQYSADVDLSTIRNPLLIPKWKSFSFITDPNSYKRVDIPFYAGGIAQGNVLRDEKGVLSAIPGLSLEIASDSGSFKTTVPVFNDGSFYYMGLPPGGYRAYVDSAQLSILGLTADPSILKFAVKPTKDGDIIEGLKIILKPRQKPTPTETKPPVKVGMTAPREKYFVQVGAFTSSERAAKFARATRIKTGQDFVEHHSSRSGLYVVQSDSLDSRKLAMERLDVMINRFGYLDAFISSSADSGTKYFFAIQFGTFRHLPTAIRYDSLIRREDHIPTQVNYNRSTGLFTVIAESYRTRREADEALGVLSKKYHLSNAVVVISGKSDNQRRFGFTLGDFHNEREAMEFARLFRFRTGGLAFVEFNRDKCEFSVFTSAFKSIREVLKAAKEIKSYCDLNATQLLLHR